jgi:hypothetical protein
VQQSLIDCWHSSTQAAILFEIMLADAGHCIDTL